MTRSPTDARSTFPLIVAGIAVAAMAVRLAGARHSLWFDEFASLYFSAQPIAKLWSGWILRETNPPLYYTMLHGWIAAFGDSDVSVRVPSIIGGGIAVVLVARLAARLYGTRAGLIAALLAAISGQQIYFSLQARGYIFAFCATTIGIEALLIVTRRLGDRPPPWRALAVYAAAASLAIYLHTTMLLFPVVGSIAALVVGFGPIRARPLALLPLLAANLAVLVVASWWIAITILQIHGGGDNIAANGVITVGHMVQHASGLFLARGNAGGVHYAIMALVALIAAGFAWIDRDRIETRFLAILVVVGVLLFALIGIKVPIYTARTLFWMSLVPLLFVAAALARLRAPGLAAGATAVVALLLAFNSLVAVRRIENEDWNGAMRAAAVPGSIMLVASESMAVNAEIACARVHGHCPITIVAVIDPADTADSWAKGLYTGPTVAIGDVATRVPAGRPIYLFRKEAFHNIVEELHAAGLAHDINNTAALVGPFSAADLR